MEPASETKMQIRAVLSRLYREGADPALLAATRGTLAAAAEDEVRATVRAMEWHRALGLVPTVYFAQAGLGGPVKIGHCRQRVDRRLAELQCGNHVRLEVIGLLPGDLALERDLHARFRALSLRGEWFSPGDELLSFVVARAQGGRPAEVAPCEHAWSPAEGAAMYRCDRCGLRGRRSLKTGLIHPISGTSEK